MYKTNKFTLLILLIMAVSSNLFSQLDNCPLKINNVCVNPLITSVPFLRIIPDARSAAVGDAGIGLSPDANAIHMNAAKLAFAEKKSAFAGSYSPWLRALGLTDVYLAYLAGYYKLDDNQAIGFGLRYFSLGNITFTDETGKIIRPGRPNEFELTASYSRALSKKLAAGISGKYIFSNLAAGQVVESTDIFAGTAFAADLSLSYRTALKMGDTKTNLMVGATVSNVGSKITYTRSVNKDYLPANLGIGAGWEFIIDDYNTVTFLLDMNKLLVPTPSLEDADQNGRPDYRDKSSISGILGSFNDAPGGSSEELKEINYSTGMEYWYDKQFALRIGYYYESPSKGNRKYVTAGLGLKYNVFTLNFSYLVPTSNVRSPLDNTLRFTFLFDFNTQKAAPVEE